MTKFSKHAPLSAFLISVSDNFWLFSHKSLKSALTLLFFYASSNQSANSFGTTFKIYPKSHILTTCNSIPPVLGTVNYCLNYFNTLLSSLTFAILYPIPQTVAKIVLSYKSFPFKTCQCLSILFGVNTKILIMAYRSYVFIHTVSALLQPLSTTLSFICSFPITLACLL